MSLKDQGDELMRSKDFRGAIAKYTEALAETPDEHTILSNRAAAY